MEFGYTVNGISTEWQPELVHIKPEQLQKQADELRNFYAMFLEVRRPRRGAVVVAGRLPAGREQRLRPLSSPTAPSAPPAT